MSRDIYCWIADATYARVAGATVTFGGFRQTSNADGWCHFTLDNGASGYALYVTADGYKPYAQSVILGQLTRDVSIGDTGQSSPQAVILPALERFSRMPPALHIEGRQFFTPDGRVELVTGFSAFGLLAKWIAGGAGAIDPLLNDLDALRAEVGTDRPLTLRAFRYAAAPNTFACAPSRFTPMQEVTDYCGQRGFRVEWTAGDASQLGMSESAQIAELAGACAAVGSWPQVLIEAKNEPFKNGGVVRPPAGYAGLWASGDYDTATLHAHMGTHLTYHGVRDDESDYPKFAYDPICQLYEGWGGFAPVTVPVFHNEPKGFGPGPGRCPDPRKALLLGWMTAIWIAGGTFHSDDGINTVPFGPVTRACAKAWLKGMTLS